MIEKIKEFLDKVLPPARYSNGEKTSCLFYRLCNVVDPIDD